MTVSKESAASAYTATKEKVKDKLKIFVLLSDYRQAEHLTSLSLFRYRRKMKYRLHSTADYHTGKIQTLGWELTVCNMLWPLDSPCRRVLRTPGSYGRLLFDYLSRFLPIPSIHQVVEIGGGYGYLMKDLLDRVPFRRTLMIDISRSLLQKQMAILASTGCEFYCEDFLSTPENRLAGMDLAIMNENLGDFPTLTDLDDTLLVSPYHTLQGPLQNARRLIDAYALNVPTGFLFNLNLGALLALEKLCLVRIPFIFIGEHSCEAMVPADISRFISARSTPNPERIALYGHEEYTIRFSDLEQLAKSHGYMVLRGPYADFLPWVQSAHVKRILMSGVDIHDQDEIIRQFITDLYQYEYLILSL